MYKLLTGLLFVAVTSVSAYAGPQERGMITGAAIGGAAGAAIGLQSNETAQGAMFGAIAGAILADRSHAAPVQNRVHHRPVHVQKRNHHRYEKRNHWRNSCYNRPHS